MPDGLFMKFLCQPLWALTGIFLVGCSVPWMQKSSENDLQKRDQAVREVMASKERPRIVGDAARVRWTETHEYEGFGVVNGLLDTGGDVKPGSQRTYILNEMRADGVENPNSILALKSTALSRIAVIVGPQHNKGDHLDAIVEIASDCDATSLRNGWLMPSHVREMALLGGAVRQSDLKARVKGPLVLLPPSVTNRRGDHRSAIILGGAQLIESRRFALAIRDDISHVTTAANMSRAINDRYSFYDGSERRGVATAKNDRMIMLDVPERYRWDIEHYADLILSIGFSETPELRAERVDKCRRWLQEPIAARNACLQLEGLGDEGIPVLSQGLTHPDPEIRLHAAYSLAYLDHPPAVPVLAELARQDSKWSARCLIGLQVLNHYSAKEALVELMQEADPWLRNGALWALRRRDPKDTLTQGFAVGDLTQVVTIPSTQPLLAVSLEERAELALFGGNFPVTMKDFYEVNSRLTIRKQDDGRLRMVRFQPKDEDLTAIVQPDVLSVLEGFRRIGATYNDVVWWLEEASQNGWVAAPIAMNPRPANNHAAYRFLCDQVEAEAAKPSSESVEVSPSSSPAETRGETSSWWPWKG
jgi:hypothetical protein